MTVESQRQTRRTCVECLNTAACWVCEGRGAVAERTGSTACAACAGHGLCRACRPVPDQRTAAEPQLTG